MNKYILTLLFALATIVGLSSCDKDDDEVVNNEETFVGTWYVESCTGGFAGKTVKYSANEVIIAFDADGKGEVVNNREDGQPFASGTFNYGFKDIEESIFDHEPTTCISFDNYFSLYSFSFDGDKVYLSQEAYDGFGYTLKRIKSLFVSSF